MFQPVLSDQQLAQAIADEHVTGRDCTFTPAVTFWAFFTQLFHAAASCRQASANQKASPQSRNQTAGVGFPLARLVVLFGLATDGLLRTRVGRRPSKGTGEGSLLAGMLDEFQAGDLLLADAGFSSFWLTATIRGVMVSAGVAVGRAAWRVSFTAAWEAIEAFAVRVSDAVSGGRAWEMMWRVIGSQVVDDCPNRSEPRVLKRRPKDCKSMTKPRHQHPRHTRSTT